MKFLGNSYIINMRAQISIVEFLLRMNREFVCFRLRDDLMNIPSLRIDFGAKHNNNYKLYGIQIEYLSVKRTGKYRATYTWNLLFGF